MLPRGRRPPPAPVVVRQRAAPMQGKARTPLPVRPALTAGAAGAVAASSGPAQYARLAAHQYRVQRGRRSAPRVAGRGAPQPVMAGVLAGAAAAAGGRPRQSGAGLGAGCGRRARGRGSAAGDRGPRTGPCANRKVAVRCGAAAEPPIAPARPPEATSGASRDKQMKAVLAAICGVVIGAVVVVVVITGPSVAQMHQTGAQMCTAMLGIPQAISQPVASLSGGDAQNLAPGGLTGQDAYRFVVTLNTITNWRRLPVAQVSQWISDPSPARLPKGAEVDTPWPAPQVERRPTR